MSSQTFECPNCDAVLAAGTDQCSRCAIRLSGPDASRLWTVDQQIGALRLERTELITKLLHPQDALVTAGPPIRVDRPSVAVDETTGFPLVADPYPHAFTGSPVTREPKKTLSGQQLLLGLGAVMLLSAASFFLLVVWLIVGIVGQALIMATLTALAVAGSVTATRRGLTAAAETAAVIATGFLLIDLTAAHSLGLAGLDRVDVDRYWTAASLFAAVLLVGFDRLVPRTTRTGEPARRIVTYRPAAAFMAAVAPWCALSALNLDGAALVAGFSAVALVNTLTGAAALRHDPAPVSVDMDLTGAPTKRTRKTPISAVILFVAAGLGFAAHILMGLGVGYDSDTTSGDRYTVFALLMLVPLLGAALSTRVGTQLGLNDTLRTRLPAWATGWSIPVLGVLFITFSYPTIVVLALGLAVAVTCVHLNMFKPNSEVRSAWLKALSKTAYAAQPFLYAVLFFLHMTHHPSLNALSEFATIDDRPSLLLVVLAAGAWAISSVAAAVYKRSAQWSLIAHAAVAATILTALWEAEGTHWVMTTLVAFAGCIALAFAAAHTSTRTTDPDNTSPDNTFWGAVDSGTVLFGGLYAVIAVLAGATESPEWLATALVTVGILTLVYAAAPARTPFAYLASLSISAGAATLMFEESTSGKGAYTVPLVVLLVAAWVIPSVAAAVYKRSAQWVLVAHTAVAITLLTALWETDETTWITSTLVAFAGCTALAFIAAHKGERTERTDQDGILWRAVDGSTAAFGALYAITAVLGGLAESPGWLATALVTVGVLTLVYAAAPNRLPFAYLGSLSISAGTATLMFEESVTTTEAYTAPLVVLLAAIGFVQWHRDRSLPTTLIMGPALSAALGPSLLAAVATGDTPRLVFVTAASIAILLVGLTQRWKAPVTVAGLVLLVIAITQGGPLTAYVPGWVTLGAAGAALLAAGVSWEKAVLAGKRANVWYNTLT